VRGQAWTTPFGDPVVQLDCPKCGKRLADVADLGADLALVDRAELRRGGDRTGPRTQQVYAEMGFRAFLRQYEVGPVSSSELWRFKCRCGARPEAHPERVHERVRHAVVRGERRIRLD